MFLFFRLACLADVADHFFFLPFLSIFDRVNSLRSRFFLSALHWSGLSPLEPFGVRGDGFPLLDEGLFLFGSDGLWSPERSSRFGVNSCPDDLGLSPSPLANGKSLL